MASTWSLRATTDKAQRLGVGEERHWEDLVQVALSIHSGKISSATLLRKMGHSSEKSKLFLVAQEVGRVIRTIYLLEWITNGKLRRAVTATTNIIESYNAFAK